jgi:hypothetical protein
MQNDLCLRFDTEEEATSILFNSQPIGFDSDGKANEWSLVSKYANVDLIGIIYAKGLNVGGYHVNVRLASGEDSSALDPYVIDVNTPIRVWA